LFRKSRLLRLARVAELSICRVEGAVRARRRAPRTGDVPLRVLAHVVGYPPLRNAGSEHALHGVMRQLRQRGHETMVLADGHGHPHELDGVEIVTDSRHASALLYEWADVVLTQLEARSGALRLAARHHRPLTLLLHLGGLDPHTTVGRFDLVVFAAAWLRDAKPWPGPSMVLHIPVDADDYRTDPGAATTLIGLSELKGSSVFYSLAERFPDRQFLGVRGAWGQQLIPSPLPTNVVVLDNTSDIRSVYARTRVLLMPSRFEVFPRTCREAALSGIPVIATPCAGIREAIGDAALYAARDDIDTWAMHLRALDDPGSYERRSRLVRAFVEGQDFTAEFDEFERRLIELAGLDVAAQR
jgi:hypothetical protein